MSQPTYFDTHCHLQDPAFDTDREAVIARAGDTGVHDIVAIASNPEDAQRAAALADDPEGEPRVYFTAGLHPHEASKLSANTRSALESCLDRGAIAVGETGLDYHYENSPRDVQRRSFTMQLELAGERDLPVVVHSREAEEDTLELIANSGIAPERVVLHCFSSSRDMLDTGIERGYYVSFSGLVTFRSFPASELVPHVPVDRLLVETDAPYLAPVPHRGRRNEPAFVVATVAALAALRGETVAALAGRTTANAHAFYRLRAGENGL